MRAAFEASEKRRQSELAACALIKNNPNFLVGKNISDAMELLKVSKLKYRITSINDVPQITIDIYNPDCISLRIKNGTVEDAQIQE